MSERECPENMRRMPDPDQPNPDWVQIANGMLVEAAKANTMEKFNDLLRSACARNKTLLIGSEI